MAITGTPKFTGLALREIAAEFAAGGNQTLAGKAAFVDQSTGVSHGWTKNEGAAWSRETIDRLYALRDSMEADMAALHFNGYTQSVTASSVRPTAELGGLGEHLEEADQA
jgi:hypothetical protein